MYDWLSVAITGLSEVASPLSPMTKSLPAARPAAGARPIAAASRASTMAWITSVLHSWAVCGAHHGSHGECPRKVGSDTSRSPSPNRLNPSTVTKMARPGNVAIHQAEARNLSALDDHVAP